MVPRLMKRPLLMRSIVKSQLYELPVKFSVSVKEQ